MNNLPIELILNIIQYLPDDLILVLQKYEEFTDLLKPLTFTIYIKHILKQLEEDQKLNLQFGRKHKYGSIYYP